MLAALALVACGGGSSGSGGSVSLISSGSTSTTTTTSTGTTSSTVATTSPATSSSSSGSVASPSLSGLEPVRSGIDVSRFLAASWGTGAIPGNEAPGVEGAFRFICAPSHNAYDDPVVFPGQPGKSHLHTFFGNTGTNANSTYTSLRTTGESTCNNLLNRSAYWVPSMMHPSGRVVMPNWIVIYYKRAPKDSKFCSEPYAKACLPLPRGLRYVFGYNMNEPSKSSPAGTTWFNCDGVGAVTGHFKSIKEAAQGCPVGAKIGMLLVGPNCWNGTDLDSPDHRSHMAYQYYDGIHGNAVCPSTHPYLLPFFEAGTWYSNDGTASQWKLSSDIAMNMEGGASAHADWFGAWEDEVQDLWTSNCIDKALSCSGGDLGNGKQMLTLMGYTFPNAISLAEMPVK